MSQLTEARYTKGNKTLAKSKPNPESKPNPDVRAVQWDDVAILKALGWTPMSIRRQLINHKQTDPDGEDPTDAIIYQWTSRERITSKWRPRLLYCALRNNQLELHEAFKVAA